MENFLLYFAKVNGLIIAFYLLYVAFLRKETFYVGNRWYLLTGLVTSVVLPLLTFTKIVWVDPEPISKYLEVVPLVDNTTIRTVSEEPMDWSLILSSTYLLVSLLIIVKVGIEIASFFNKIIKLSKQKDSNFTLIYSNSTENPFSFFKYIVINPTLFSKEEYEHIITHERIHAKQFHSIDVLISKVFCALFWINPISWLYRKAMLQNLEFIADNHSLKQIENKYEYQKTLLKVVVQQQTAGFTNPFYQSLIKKRIIMLHTNQSHKRNAWKYATILPVLVGFMLLFQIETIAQVKDNFTIAVDYSHIIDKKTTDKEIQEIETSFKDDESILKISNVKRNNNEEIIAIRLEFYSKKNSKTKTIKEIRGDKPIQPIRIFIRENKDNEKSIGFEEVSNIAIGQLITNAKDSVKTIIVKQKRVVENSDSEGNPNEKVIIVNRTDSNDDEKITFVTRSSSASVLPEPIIYLNDKEISKIELDNLDPKTIKSVDVKKGKSNGEIRIVTSSNFINNDPEILLDNKVISKDDLNKLDKNEIESININNHNRKKIIEIQRKNAKSIRENSLKEIKYVTGNEEAKEELNKAKIELEKAKAEIEKARKDVKIEIEKAKLELEKAKAKAKFELEKAKEKAKNELEKTKIKKK